MLSLAFLSWFLMIIGLSTSSDTCKSLIHLKVWKFRSPKIRRSQWQIIGKLTWRRNSFNSLQSLIFLMSSDSSDKFWFQCFGDIMLCGLRTSENTDPQPGWCAVQMRDSGFQEIQLLNSDYTFPTSTVLHIDYSLT